MSVCVLDSGTNQLHNHHSWQNTNIRSSDTIRTWKENNQKELHHQKHKIQQRKAIRRPTPQRNECTKFVCEYPHLQLQNAKIIHGKTKPLIIKQLSDSINFNGLTMFEFNILIGTYNAGLHPKVASRQHKIYTLQTLKNIKYKQCSQKRMMMVEWSKYSMYN